MANLVWRYGTMNASKSAIALITDYNYNEVDGETLVAKPKIDDRSGEFIVSRALKEEKEPDFLIEKDTNIFEKVKELMKDKTELECLTIDEAQFLTKEQVWQLTEIVDELNVHVLCYGLKTDFRGEGFEGSIYLWLWADKSEEIPTICVKCPKPRKKARFVVRLNDGEPEFEGKQVQIGGNESYISVCRKDFKKLRKQYFNNIKTNKK